MSPFKIGVSIQCPEADFNLPAQPVDLLDIFGTKLTFGQVGAHGNESFIPFGGSFEPLIPDI